MDVRKIPTPGVVDERRREQIQDRDDLNDRSLDIQGSVSALTVGALIGGKIANVEFFPMQNLTSFEGFRQAGQV